MKLTVSNRIFKGLLGVTALAAGLECSDAAAKNACDLAQTVSAGEGAAGLCGFNASTKSFKGSKKEQAQCLTRQVNKGAKIGDPTITDDLASLLETAPPSIERLKSFIDKQGIMEAELGGALNHTISASYFIIHDTSTPNCSGESVSAAVCPTRGKFPPNLDGPDWVVNKNFLGHPKPYPNRLAHVFTNRVGASITEVDFSEHITTTKFEKCFDAQRKKSLFVGIENIQPRVGDPAIPKPGKKLNDLVAPTRGFADAQYERLALLYITASSRHGEWLILAHHAVLDHYFADGHDDPQNFDMNKLSTAVSKTLEKIK